MDVFLNLFFIISYENKLEIFPFKVNTAFEANEEQAMRTIRYYNIGNFFFFFLITRKLA